MLPQLAAAFLAGVVAGLVALCLRAEPAPAAGSGDGELPRLKATFRRPVTLPFPVNNVFSEPKRALGERLFHDPRLSADGRLACATCHQRQAGFADGRARSEGATGKPLSRHTPTLWNLAWAAHVFWDGRARSLEEQAASPIESADEMAQPMPQLLQRLSDDADYARAFAEAFPDDPRMTRENLTKAIATFERTLVSPPTQFDRWVAGDDTALTPSEIAGFRLFTGEAGCARCHSGFAFTDYAFHDIGLPGDDRGRGAVLRLPAAEHAFKTPSLRELGRSAPYMHDGSLTTLEQVVWHYETGIVDRPTLSPDLPRGLSLRDDQRAALIAFLHTLTSDGDPQPPSAVIAEANAAVAAEQVAIVTQRDKAFSPVHVAMRQGERLWIVNNDTRTHNVRVFDDAFEFDSGAQEPGETIEIAFPAGGEFLVFCGIHPKMELHVDVKP